MSQRRQALSEQARLPFLAVSHAGADHETKEMALRRIRQGCILSLKLHPLCLRQGSAPLRASRPCRRGSWSADRSSPALFASTRRRSCLEAAHTHTHTHTRAARTISAAPRQLRFEGEWKREENRGEGKEGEGRMRETGQGEEERGERREEGREEKRRGRGRRREEKRPINSRRHATFDPVKVVAQPKRRPVSRLEKIASSL